MSKPASEQCNRFMLKVMKPLEKEESPQEVRKSGRSSFSSIPPPDLSVIFKKKTKQKTIEVVEEVKPQSENLIHELCNSYKFVVNYGVFEPNFEWLPLELLISVFEFLDQRDLFSAGLVCRQWMEATQYFRLTRKTLLHFQVFNYSDTGYPMNRFINCSRFFPNIKFSIVKFAPKNNEFWEDFGDMVEELTFNSCFINKPEFLHIIRMCPRLRQLSITRCEDLFKSWAVVKKLSTVKLKFPFMKSLSFYETSQMTRAVFDFMVASAPNISSLTLSNCFGESKPIDRVQILDSLIQFLTSRAGQIKVLNLLYTPTDELFLQNLADVKNLNLDELRFTFNGVVATTGRSGILSLLRTQTDLKVLDVTDSKGLSNFCLMEICRYMTQLKKLTLKQCWQLNDVGLGEVNRLLDLKYLDISCCDRITDTGILEGLVKRGREVLKIKELYLGLLPYMSIVAIYRLAQQYDELEVLDLSGSSNSITDEALHMIFRYQVKLTTLNLDCCAKITDYGLTGLTDPNETVNPQKYVTFNINMLTELRFLNLGGCYQITDKTFYNAIDLAELKEINLSRCHNITEVGIQHLCRKCQKLESIDLSECFNVRNSTVCIITKDIRWLETLKLNGCKQITCEIFYDIAENCKNLKNLYIRRCPKILANPFDVLKNVRYVYSH